MGIADFFRKIGLLRSGKSASTYKNAAEKPTNQMSQEVEQKETEEIIDEPNADPDSNW